MLEAYSTNGFFPAFRGGFTAVARDESRHVVFGVKFLREMIQRDAAYARVVHDAVEKYAPTALAAIDPAPEQVKNILAAGSDPWISPSYEEETLAKKMKVVGLCMKHPN